jgi:ketosteroid isomerase-like protein
MRWIALALAGVLAAPAAQAQSSYQADSAAIAAAGRAFSAAYVANDSMALGALYVDTAVAFPASRDVVGRAAIRHLFAWPEGYRQVAHSLTVERLTIEGDLAVDVGMWHSTGQRAGQEPSSSSGRYLVVWTRTAGGDWRMLYDMWHPPPRSP